jgi:hypothetical protein
MQTTIKELGMKTFAIHPPIALGGTSFETAIKPFWNSKRNPAQRTNESIRVPKIFSTALNNILTKQTEYFWDWKLVYQ